MKDFTEKLADLFGMGNRGKCNDRCDHHAKNDIGSLFAKLFMKLNLFA